MRIDYTLGSHASTITLVCTTTTLVDAMLVHRRLPPSISSGFPDSLLGPIYTPGWRGAL